MTSLIQQLEADLKAAAVERDNIRLNVVRLLKSALKNFQIEAGHELSPQEMLSVIQKEAKKRQDSISAYTKAGRDDLATEEQNELKVIEAYLPEQLSDEELSKIVDQVIRETGATGMADMGKVIGVVVAKADGRADGGRISGIVKSKLG